MIMSDFAFFRFMSNGMLTSQEMQHREEIIRLTEEVLHSKGLQRDASIAKISMEELQDILAKVRELRKKRKEISAVEAEIVNGQQVEADKEVQYIR